MGGGTLLLLFSLGGGGTPGGAFLDATLYNAWDIDGNGNTVITLSQAVPSCHSILITVVTVGTDLSGDTTPVIVDSALNTYTLLEQFDAPGAAVNDLRMWVFGCFGTNALAIGNTITITHATVHAYGVNATAWSNLKAYDTHVVATGGYSATAPTLTTPTLLTTARRTLLSVFGVTAPFGPLGMPSWATGETALGLPNLSSVANAIVGYRASQAAGSYTAQASSPFAVGTNYYALALLAFEEGNPCAEEVVNPNGITTIGTDGVEHCICPDSLIQLLPSSSASTDVLPTGAATIHKCDC